GHL
ncbi:hypothetical protein S40285_09660, partial [Stachybotrys chlorohalonatus IBT 40285]